MAWVPFWSIRHLILPEFTYFWTLNYWEPECTVFCFLVCVEDSKAHQTFIPKSVYQDLIWGMISIAISAQPSR